MSENSNTENYEIRKDGPNITILIRVPIDRAEEILRSFGFPLPKVGELDEIRLLIDRSEPITVTGNWQPLPS